MSWISVRARSIVSTMRRLLTVLALFASFASFAAATGEVVKVLPFLLDTHGQIAKSPSLFDRDAYQAYLRTLTTHGGTR